MGGFKASLNVRSRKLLCTFSDIFLPRGSLALREVVKSFFSWRGASIHIIQYKVVRFLFLRRWRTPGGERDASKARFLSFLAAAASWVCASFCLCYTGRRLSNASCCFQGEGSFGEGKRFLCIDIGLTQHLASKDVIVFSTLMQTNLQNICRLVLVKKTLSRKCAVVAIKNIRRKFNGSER